jgi:hypothetical protein
VRLGAVAPRQVEKAYSQTFDLYAIGALPCCEEFVIDLQGPQVHILVARVVKFR